MCYDANETRANFYTCSRNLDFKNSTHRARTSELCFVDMNAAQDVVLDSAQGVALNAALGVGRGMVGIRWVDGR